MPKVNPPQSVLGDGGHVWEEQVIKLSGVADFFRKKLDDLQELYDSQSVRWSKSDDGKMAEHEIRRIKDIIGDVYALMGRLVSLPNKELAEIQRRMDRSQGSHLYERNIHIAIARKWIELRE